MLRLTKSTLVVAVVLAGCTKTATDKGFVARVGDAVLTQADISHTQGDSTGSLRRQAIGRWINSELLFQEAERRGFDKSDAVVHALTEAKRQLVINAFLEQEVYANLDKAISDEDILDEFNRNPSSYRLREDVVNMSYALFADRDAANSFRSSILRGTSWDDAMKRVESDSEESQLLRSATGYFTQATLYPEELWKMARTLTKGDVSYVIRTDAGHVIALVHGMKKQGDLPDLDFAQNEIRERLTMQRRMRRYEELLTSLRSQYPVDVRGAIADSSADMHE